MEGAGCVQREEAAAMRVVPARRGRAETTEELECNSKEGQWVRAGGGCQEALGGGAMCDGRKRY